MGVETAFVGTDDAYALIGAADGGAATAEDTFTTTTGTVKVKTNAQGWNGAFIFRGGKGHDVLIKDTNLEITNPGGKYHQVVAAFYAQVQANITVAGNAKITASAQRMAADANAEGAGSDKTNRSFGLYLAAGSNCVFKDNAQLVASAGGDANASWTHGASAIYTNASTLTVQDKAVVNGTAAGNSIPALAMEGASTLNVKGEAVVNLTTTSSNALQIVTNTAAINVTECGVINCDAKGSSVSGTGTLNFAAKNDVSEKTNVLASKTAVAPTNVANSDVTASSAKITWDKVAGATEYKVFAGETLVATVATNEATITVVPETTYSVTVKAVNAAGIESAASAATTFTTPKGEPSIVPPTAPTNVKVSAITQTTAKVTWTAVEGATSYDVYVGTEKVATVDVAEAALTGLTADTDYKVTVVASNIAGASEKSAEVAFKTVKTGVVTSVDVILADGTKVTLNAETPSVNGATGTIVFDAAAGTVTLTDVTGVQAVTAATNVDLTYVIKGTNTLETAEQTNVLRAYNVNVIGDGTLNIKSTKASGAYTILGQKSITIGGKVTFNLENTAGTAMHVARGFKGAEGEDSVCFYLFKDNAKINIKVAGGYPIYGTGHKVSLIVTDNADVYVEGKGSDTIYLKCDTISKYTTTVPGTYMEVSGNAKLVVPNGNCGLRAQYAIDGSGGEGWDTIAGDCSVVFKGNAVVDITAPGQVIYPCDVTKNNTAKNTASFTVADNANVKLTVGGPASNGSYYPCLQMVSDANTVTISGGSLTLDGAGQKNVLAFTGKTTYDIADGYKSFVGGNDAASAEDASKFDTSKKYFQITFETNPGTSDVSYIAAASVAVIAVLAGVAVVILRKKSENR